MSFTEREILEKLSKVQEIDKGIFECLLDKLEFNKVKRFKHTARQIARRYLTRGLSECFSRLTVDQLIKRVNIDTGKKKVLFLAGHPTFDLLGISLYLRERGEHETILLIENPLLIATMEGYFDTVYVYDSFYDVARIINRVNPYVIHVQGAINYYFFGIVARFLSSSKVVVGLYDIPAFGIKQDDYKNLWGDTDTMLDSYAGGEFAFKHADGVLVTIHSLEAGQILKQRFRSDVPIIEFHSYVCEDFIGDEEKLSRSDGCLHLVYGGIVIPSHLPRRLFGDVQFFGLIETITRQNIYFDIYPSPHFRPWMTRRRLSDYVTLSRENQFFKYRESILPNVAAPIFSKYDFAAMMYFIDGVEIDQEHHRMVIPSKFFKYLEAGLPILVSEELHYVAKLVREYEIGIVVSRRDIDSLAETVARYDYNKLKSNVMVAQRELSMGQHIDRLIEFYEHLNG